MIDRTFDGLKFKRTYIGGSKEKEIETFIKVQGDESKDYENCDWVSLRNINMQYFDDYLNVIFSWRHIFKNISYGFGILALILLFFHIYHSLSSAFLWVIGITLLISLIFQGIYLFFLHKQEVEVRNYDFALGVINDQIEKKTGLKLKKNPHLNN